jgi:hypothetical protein
MKDTLVPSIVRPDLRDLCRTAPHVRRRFIAVAILGLAQLLLAAAAIAASAVSEQYEWSPTEKERKRTFSFGDVKVQVKVVRERDDDVFENTYDVRFLDRGIVTFKVQAQSAHGLTVQFAELDVGNSKPEVLLSTFSGGMHCCYGTEVYRFDNGRWRLIPSSLGADGVAPRAEDIDKDGQAEILELDGTFFYSFTSYAGSYALQSVYQLVGSKFVDVTKQPEFWRANVFKSKDVREACAQRDSNGFWGPYVASETMKGRGRVAWQKMLTCYDELFSWGLCQPGAWENIEPVLEDFGPVPEGAECHVKFRQYPIALYNFLTGTKYGAPIPLREFRQYEAKVIKGWPAEKERLARMIQKWRQQEEGGKAK